MVGGIDFGRTHGCLGAHGECTLLGGGCDWRLGEVTNLPRFRPLDIGPIDYTGQSQDSNFLPPNISLARFRVTPEAYLVLRSIFGSRSINIFGSLELNFQDLSNFTDLYS